jgi:hypothetical protein
VISTSAVSSRGAVRSVRATVVPPLNVLDGQNGLAARLFGYGKPTLEEV